MRTVLFLERKNPDSGRWVSMWISKPDLTIPGAFGHTFTAVAPFCMPGRWQMRAKITGNAQGGTPFEVDAPTRASNITC